MMWATRQQIAQRLRPPATTPETVMPADAHGPDQPRWPLLAAWRTRIRPHWVLLAVVLAVALTLDLHMLGSISVWFDEAISYVVVHQHFGDMWRDIWGSVPNMELYFVMLYVWLKVTALMHLPPDELILRLPSAICAALSAGMVYLIGRRLWSTRVGVVAALLYAANPLQLYYAQQARSYSLELLLICCGWFALFSALAAPAQSKRWWVAYTAAMTLAIYAHIFSGWVVVAQITTFAGLVLLPGPWRASARASMRTFALVLCATGALILPLVKVSIYGKHNDWVPATNLGAVRDFFVISVSGGSVAYLALIGLASALAVLIGGASLLPDHVQRRLWLTADAGSMASTHPTARPRPGAFAVLCWLVVPLVCSFVLTQGWLNLHFFLARYLVVVIPPICLLAALGLRLLRPAYLQIALTAALLLVAALQVPAYYASADTQDFRAVNFWLQQRYQPGDGIACYPQTWCRLPMDYYVQAQPGPAHFDPNSPDWDLSTRTLAAYAAQHTRVFVIIAIFDPSPQVRSQVRTLQAWMDGHYQLVDQLQTGYLSYQFTASPLQTTVTIRLYEPRGAAVARAVPDQPNSLAGSTSPIPLFTPSPTGYTGGGAARSPASRQQSETGGERCYTIRCCSTTGTSPPTRLTGLR